MLPRMLLVLALFGGASMVEAASFPCEKARSRIEKTLCADPELSQLDNDLDRYYQAARMDLRGSEECLKADQKHWLKAVRDVCADKACLKAAYLDRLSELDALQPGVSAIKYRTLPNRPSLVWVIPPALDKVAAPDNPKARPLEARGSLVDEMVSGDGFVLRTPKGESYLVVTAMLLDGETSVRLPELAKDGKATYLVRGYEEKDPRGGRHYAASRCTYIYRLH